LAEQRKGMKRGHSWSPVREEIERNQRRPAGSSVHGLPDIMKSWLEPGGHEHSIPLAPIPPLSLSLFQPSSWSIGWRGKGK